MESSLRRGNQDLLALSIIFRADSIMSKFIPALLTIIMVGTFAANAQTVRPIPYPVIPNVKFDRAVENGTRTSTGEPIPIHR